MDLLMQSKTLGGTHREQWGRMGGIISREGTWSGMILKMPLSAMARGDQIFKEMIANTKHL